MSWCRLRASSLGVDCIPPADYSLRDASEKQSMQLISSQYPSLMDLVEDGSLVVFERHPNHVEWRTDGHVEPEQIFILGTCHLSSKSACDAQRVIETINPENVILELCRSRVAVLDEQNENQDMPNPFLLSGDSFYKAFMRSLNLGGGFVFIFRALLASLTQRIGQNFDIKIGVEMRSAYQTAESIGAQIVLGDRPIEITLKRAWEALNPKRKLKLISLLVSGLLTPDAAIDQMLAKVKPQIDTIDQDLISEWTREMTNIFPELTASLIHERDLCLSWSLKRSKAVNGSQSVVGIVGKGHMKGIYFALQNDEGKLKFKDLVGPTSRNASNTTTTAEGIIKRVILEMIIFILSLILIKDFLSDFHLLFR